jgi:hypothetical protein
MNGSTPNFIKPPWEFDVENSFFSAEAEETESATHAEGSSIMPHADAARERSAAKQAKVIDPKMSLGC